MKELFILKDHRFKVIDKDLAKSHPEKVSESLWAWFEIVGESIRHLNVSLIEHAGELYILFSKEFTNPQSVDWEGHKSDFPKETSESLIKQLLLEYCLSVKDSIKHGETYLGFNSGEGLQHEVLFLYPINTEQEVIKRELFFIPAYSNEKLCLSTLLYFAMKEAEKMESEGPNLIT